MARLFNVLCLLVALVALAVAWKAVPRQRLLPLPRLSAQASETPRPLAVPAEHTVARAAGPQERTLDHRAGW